MAAAVAAATPKLTMQTLDVKSPLDAPPPSTPFTPTTPSTTKHAFFENKAWNAAVRHFRDNSEHKKERLEQFLKRHKNERDVKKTCEERKQHGSDQYGKVMSKVLDKIDIFLTAGNIAVKGAPESVGLAWMGISLVLGAAQDDYQTLQVFGNGCADIVGIMITSRLLVKMFMVPEGPPELKEIQDKVLEEATVLYGKIIEFSYQAWKFSEENRIRECAGQVLCHSLTDCSQCALLEASLRRTKTYSPPNSRVRN